jgi:hypothetical protein
VRKELDQPVNVRRLPDPHVSLEERALVNVEVD